jgi:hypothetical protein
MLGILSISPEVEGRQVEVWNSVTPPRRILFKDGRWQIASSFERAGAATPYAPPRSVPGGETLRVRLAILPDKEHPTYAEDELKKRDKEATIARAWVYYETFTSIGTRTDAHAMSFPREIEGNFRVPDFEMMLPPKDDPAHDVLIIIRVYEPAPIRKRVAFGEEPFPASCVKLNQASEVAVTRDQLNLSASLPMYISSDEYCEPHASDPSTFRERARLVVLPWEIGSWPKLADAITKEAIERAALPPEPLLRMERLVLRNIILPENRAIASIRPLFSKDIRDHCKNWKQLVIAPLNYKLTGQLLFPRSNTILNDLERQVGRDLAKYAKNDLLVDEGTWLRSLGKDAKHGESAARVRQTLQEREYAGLSAQAPWYHDRKRPAVEEAWILASLGEVLAARGMDLEVWRKTVTGMLSGARGEWSEEERACLSIYVRLIQIHSTTRQYNYDHQWDWKTRTWIDTDTLKRTLTAIDDCDGSAAGTYAIAMTILFPPGPRWNDPDAELVRRLGAIVGVPFGVTGTVSGKNHREAGGHMFCALVPFPTFAKAIDAPRDLGEAFKKTFGFRAPAHHTKPSVCENIYFSTPYYSDHRGTSAMKKRASGRVAAFVDRFEEGHADWLHVTSTHVMGKEQSCQNHVFRMFTDFLDHVSPRSGVAIKRAGGGVFEASSCRSFVPFMSDAPDVSSEFPYFLEGRPDAPRTLGPELDAFIETLTGKERRAAEDRRMQIVRLRGRMNGARGYGLPIELLAHGRPRFELHATINPSPEAVAAEKKLIETYEHPIVPLPDKATDLFASDPNWMDTVLSAIRDSGSFRLIPKAPSHSNERVSLYAYDLGELLGQFVAELEALYRELGANGLYVGKYGWCLIFVLSLRPTNPKQG